MRLPTRNLIVATLIGATSASAQCTPNWSQPDGLGAEGRVRATTRWDPDGAGPDPEYIVMVGSFRSAGTVVANNIVLYEPLTATWTPVGDGTNGEVRAVTALPNGDLVIGGRFETAGTATANGIARWDGASWHAMGTGIAIGAFESVEALLTRGSGVVAAGQFTSMNGVATANVAHWNGISWQSMGAGIPDASSPPTVRALVTMSNGDVMAGGASAARIMIWNGTTWSAGNAPLATSINVLHLAPNGDIYAGSNTLPTNGSVHRWLGNGWQQIGRIGWTGTSAVAALPNGDLIAGSDSGSGMLRWDGSSWQQIGLLGGLNRPYVITPMPELGPDHFLVGGVLDRIGGQPARGVALWDGNGFVTEPELLNGRVFALASDPQGGILVGGEFTIAGGTPAARIARFDGSTWQQIGPGTGVAVRDIVVLQTGEIAAATTNNVRVFDGNNWRPVPGTTGGAHALVELANGDLAIAGGGVRIWSGSTTSNTANINSPLFLDSLPNGDLVAAGDRWTFYPSDATVGTWNGTAWTPLDPGRPAGVECGGLVARPNGDVAVIYAPAGEVAIWNGNGWNTITGGMTGQVTAIANLPGGDLLATGNFDGPTAGIRNAARWDGQSWHPVDGLLIVGNRLAVAANGEVFASSYSWFSSSAIATLSNPCRPTRSVLGSGCPNSNGPALLQATAWPHLGANYEARVSGLPTMGFVADLYGLQANTIALPSLLPEGQPGCNAYVTPLSSTVRLPQNGMVMSGFAVPLDPAFLGVTLHHQMLPVETDAQGTIVTVTATDALTLTVGTVL